MRRTITIAVATAFGLLAPLTATAQDEQSHEAVGFTAEEVLKTTKTNTDEPITYPTGTAEITSVRATIEPGGHSVLHQHVVPTYVYVMEGEVEVQNEGAEPVRYTAGQGFVEALNRNLQVFNVAEATTELLVVFVGQEGQPGTVTTQ